MKLAKNILDIHRIFAEKFTPGIFEIGVDNFVVFKIKQIFSNMLNFKRIVAEQTYMLSS